MGAPYTRQRSFRGRYDDGGETGATWIDILNANWVQDVDTTFRVRIQVSETAGGNFANRNFKAQSNTNAGGWQDITTSSSNVKMVSSANDGWTITDDDATTEQLAGSQTFVTGRYDDDGLTETSISLLSTDTELEFCLQLVGSDLSDEDSIQIRVVEDDGSTLSLYENTPTIEANKATSPVTVNLDPLSVTSAALGLSVVPGAVSVPLDLLSVSSAVLDVAVSSATTIPLDLLSVASAVLDLSVVPGAASVALDLLSVASAVLDLSVVPGAASVALDLLSVTSAALGVTVVPGAVSVPLDLLSVASAALDVTVVPGAVSVPLDLLSVASAALDVTVQVGGVSPVTIPLDLLSVASAALGLSVVPGAVSVPLDLLSVASAALDVSVVPGSVSVPLDLLSVASAALGLSVVPGSVSVPLQLLSVTAAALDVSVNAGGDVLISLDTLGVVAAVLTLRAFIPNTGRTWQVHAEGRGGATGEVSRTWVVPARSGNG